MRTRCWQWRGATGARLAFVAGQAAIDSDFNIVGLDVGALWRGYHADAARTFAVGKVAPEARRLMVVTREALASFRGVQRRFTVLGQPTLEKGGKTGDVMIVDEGPGFDPTPILLAPLALLNLAVAFFGNSVVFPLSPFFLRNKLAALGRYALHRPVCLFKGHADIDTAVTDRASVPGSVPAAGVTLKATSR